MEPKELAGRLAVLEARVAAMQVAIDALMATAPDQVAFHLAMTKALEAAAGHRIGPFRPLTDYQIQQARDLVEHWGTLPNAFSTVPGAPPPAPPSDQR